MKEDLRAELNLMNQNVEEMIRLCQAAADAGVWTCEKAQTHMARLKSFRAQLHVHFQELMALRESLHPAREHKRK
jgi:hypothetical protein